MSEASTVITPQIAAPASAMDYVQLMKPRVMSLVVFTALAGLVAAPGPIDPFAAAVAILAVALGSGAAGALNMWYDADIDRLMARTATRPVPSGRIAASEALAFGLIMSAMSVTLMALAATLIAALLLAFSIFFYAVVYTMWLKRSTAQNIVIGGAAGAFPPVIGWAAVTGTVPLDAWILFGLIFLWTPPHFWALSLWTSKEYARAGVPMLPVTKGAKETRKQILLYTLVSAPFGLAPVFTGLGGMIYLVVASLGGAAFLWGAVRVFMSRAGDADARKDLRHAHILFGISIFYLFALFAALLVEHAFGLHFPVTVGGGA
ncbi:MAG TPA: heme o synthase [Hyphomonadaceae bacterium]|jgi:protoheme IX farnesyltransferase|nr:heme o synthase [Hyphomonadaceae bacterium]